MTDPDEVLQHIRRTDLPWREATKTRCGRLVAELAADRVIPLDEARAKVKRLGKQRAAMFLCMTCCNHIDDWPEWDADPVTRMERECAGGRWRKRDSDLELVERELRAIAMLVLAHRDEFDAAVNGLGEVESLTDIRASRAAARRYSGGRPSA